MYHQISEQEINEYHKQVLKNGNQRLKFIRALMDSNKPSLWFEKLRSVKCNINYWHMYKKQKVPYSLIQERSIHTQSG
jgi:hypothetical protein